MKPEHEINFCPACGSPAAIQKYSGEKFTDKRQYTVACIGGCDCVLSTRKCDSESEAIKQWEAMRSLAWISTERGF